jgi:hypothetical protein
MRRARWFGGWICALPSVAFAISEEPARAQEAAWAPALAAWGTQVAPSTGVGSPSAPVLGSPSAGRGSVAPLAAVGQGATDAIANPDSAAELRTREGVPIDETQRWVPGFALHSGLLGQNADGSIGSDSTVTYDYRIQETTGSVVSIPAANQILRVTRRIDENKSNSIAFVQQSPTAPRFPIFLPNSSKWGFNPNILPPFPRTLAKILVTAVDPSLPTHGSELFLTPFSGASLELMTPGVQQAPGRPRLFVHGGAATAFSFTRNVAKEGIPGAIQFPTQGLDANGQPEGLSLANEAELKGIGSRTSGEVKHPVFSAGFGTAFTLDALERRLRIKPSFEWMRQEIEVTGELVRLYRKDTGRSQGPLLPPESFFLEEPIHLQASDTRAFHGIGPGLEVEMDAGRAGPVALTLFVSGQAYYMLGDLDVHLLESQEISDPSMVPNTQTVSADFDFNLHQWSYQGGLGIRFRWLPED